MPAGTRHHRGDLRQGLTRAHGRQCIAGPRGGRRRCAGGCTYRRLASSGALCIAVGHRRSRWLARDGITGTGARRFNGRLGDRGSGVGRIDQGGISTHQAALAPLHFDQEVDHRLVHRLAAGHANHRAPACVLRKLELQIADQALRALQTDPRERGGRCQRHARVVEFARLVGDDRNLGHQRLPGLGQHPDIAQPQCHGSAAAGHQQQRTYPLYRTHRAPAPLFHGHQYSRSMSEKVGVVMQSDARVRLPQCGMHVRPMQTARTDGRQRGDAYHARSGPSAALVMRNDVRDAMTWRRWRCRGLPKQATWGPRMRAA